MHDGADADVQKTTSKCANVRDADDSLTKPASPRAALLAHLAEELRAAVLVGDIEAARIAHGAIGRLLGAKWRGREASSTWLPSGTAARAGSVSGVMPDDAVLGSEHETYYSTSQGEFTMTQFVVFCSKGHDGWRLRVRSPEPGDDEGDAGPQGLPLADAGSRTLLHCAGDEEKLEILVQAILKDAVEGLSLAKRVEEQASPKRARTALLN